MAEPVDGFTVWSESGSVILILSNRYGDDDVQYTFNPADAIKIARALLMHARYARLKT